MTFKVIFISWQNSASAWVTLEKKSVGNFGVWNKEILNQK